MTLEFNFEPLTDTELAEAPVPEPEEIRLPIVPVPAAALPLQYRHRRLGGALKTWAYLNSQGELVGYIALFTDGEGNRHFRPLTFCRTSKGNKWCAEGFPAPYPLYNLTEVLARLDVPVLIVRGEENADAAKQLFPGCAVVSAPYEDGLLLNADWSTLRNREVIVFPDRDDREEDFAATVSDCAYRAGASSVRTLSARSIARFAWKDGAKLHRPVMPPRWGAVHALADGWDAELLSVHIGALKNLPLQPKPLAFDAFGRPTFRMTNRGVEGLVELKQRGESVFTWVWICAALLVTGQSRTSQGEGWGKSVQFVDGDGKRVELDVPAKDLAGDGTSVRELLLSKGLRATTHRKARELLIEYLATCEHPKRILNVPAVGWQDGAFVTANAVIGIHASGEDVQYAGASSTLVGVTGGSYKSWQDGPATWAIGNSRLLFAISAALSAPLIKLMGGESGGFHFVGPSSIGKTTLLHVAGSVWGGSQPHGYLKSWRTTDNAAEATANAHSDALLCLDEISEATPDAIGKVAYMLANGQGKLRMTSNGTLRRTFVWRSTFLSTGEVSLKSKIAETNGKLPTAGQEVRFVSVPADAGVGKGLFEDLHGFTSAEEFARKLKEVSLNNYGHAAIAFLNKLVVDLAKMTDVANNHSDAFLRNLGEQGVGDGQVQRVARRFACIAAAGELAAELGIVPWAVGIASHAVARVYSEWLKNRGGVESQEDIRAIETIRYFLLKNGAGHVGTSDPVETPAIDKDNWGFVKRPPEGDFLGEVIFCFYLDAWKREVCAGLNPHAVARALKKAGLLVHDKDRLTSVHRYKHRNHRVYAVRESILVGNEPQEQTEWRDIQARPAENTSNVSPVRNILFPSPDSTVAAALPDSSTVAAPATPNTVTTSVDSNTVAIKPDDLEDFKAIAKKLAEERKPKITE